MKYRRNWLYNFHPFHCWSEQQIDYEEERWNRRRIHLSTINKNNNNNVNQLTTSPSHLCSQRTRWRTNRIGRRRRRRKKWVVFFPSLCSVPDASMSLTRCLRRSLASKRLISTIELTRNAVASKPIEWNDLIQWLQTGQQTPLWRDEDCARRYIEHQKSIAREYRSINDYVRIRYLQWTTDYDPTSQKRIATPSATAIREPLLTPNNFPYYLVQGIQHWLIWCDPEPKEPEKIVEDVMNKEFPLQKFERISFINPPRLRSISAVFHAHVFTRECQRHSSPARHQGWKLLFQEFSFEIEKNKENSTLCVLYHPYRGVLFALIGDRIWDEPFHSFSELKKCLYDTRSSLPLDLDEANTSRYEWYDVKTFKNSQYVCRDERSFWQGGNWIDLICEKTVNWFLKIFSLSINFERRSRPIAQIRVLSIFLSNTSKVIGVTNHSVGHS